LMVIVGDDLIRLESSMSFVVLTVRKFEVDAWISDCEIDC